MAEGQGTPETRRGLFDRFKFKPMNPSESPEVNASESRSPLEKLTEKVRISDKLTITALPIEHTEPLNKEDLQKLVDSTDGAILEYVPRELEEVQNNPVIKTIQAGYYKQIMDFFTPLQDAYFKARKNVYSVDPAHNIDFPTFFRRNLIYAGMGVGIAGVVTGLNTGRKIYEKISELLGKQVSKRAFLKKAGLAGAGVAAAELGYEASQWKDVYDENKSGQTSSFRVESDFRRVVDAEGLKQLGQSIDQHSDRELNLLLVYPVMHWKAINQKLNDPNNRSVFERCRATLGSLNSFFTIRKFHPTSSGEVTKQETRMS